MNIAERIKHLRQEAHLQDIEYEKEHREMIRKRERLESKAQKELFPKLCSASKHYYETWLRSYVENGGNPTHIYDYNFPEGKFYRALADFEILPLCGTSSINIIVPTGINFLGGDLGHCNIFFMDGYKAIGCWIPLYKDMNFEER